MNETSVVKLGKTVFPIIQQALDEHCSGVKAFPVIAPKNTLGTIVVYARDGAIEPQTVFNSRGCTLQVNVVSEEYDEGVDVANIVVNALLGQDSFVCEMVDLMELYKDNKYYQAIAFEINFY